MSYFLKKPQGQIRDWMVLISEGYIDSKSDSFGVLILREMDGIGKELGKAIISNPNHKQEIVSGIIWWANDFISNLLKVNKQKITFKEKILYSLEKAHIIKDFYTSNLGIIFLDHKGRLVSFKNNSRIAKPDLRLLKLIKLLSKYPKTEFVIVLSRDKSPLKKWFGKLNIFLSARHGFWIKNKDWRDNNEGIFISFSCCFIRDYFWLNF